MRDSIKDKYPHETPSQQTRKIIDLLFELLGAHLKNISDLRPEFSSLEVSLS
jgi:hypothetical protein